MDSTNIDPRMTPNGDHVEHPAKGLTPECEASMAGIMDQVAECQGIPTNAARMSLLERKVALLTEELHAATRDRTQAQSDLAAANAEILQLVGAVRYLWYDDTPIGQIDPKGWDRRSAELLEKYIDAVVPNQIEAQGSSSGESTGAG